MAFSDRRSPRDRALGALGAVALPGLFLWGLWTGLEVDLSRAASTALNVFAITPEPPPPEPEPKPPPPPPKVEQPAPRPIQRAGEEGAASAANLRSRAAPVVAPPVERPLLTTPFPAAPVPASGSDATSGASDTPGPGTGAGGEGTGFGSGRGGDGTGGGGGGTVPAVEAVKIAGSIRAGERPRDTDLSRPRRVVGVNFTILPTGRVTGCTVAETSGDASLDRFTCRTIEQRWRYRPARDRYGRPVRDEQGWYQVYTFDGSEPVLPGR